MAGLFEEVVGWLRSPQRTQQMQGIGNALANAEQRAGLFNQLNRQAAEEFLATGDIYGPKSQEVAMQLANAYNPVGMTAYHGTPHNIVGKFDASRIGSGEGGQAYGYGMYFAQNPKVSAEYAKMGGSQNLYKVDIPNEMIPKMLDYDLPLAKQKEVLNKVLSNPTLKKALEDDLAEKNFAMRRVGAKNIQIQDLKGRDVLETLNAYFDDASGKVAADYLGKLGLTGVRYYDQFSRMKPPIKREEIVSAINKAEQERQKIIASKNPYAERMLAANKQGLDRLKENLERWDDMYSEKRTKNMVVFPGFEQEVEILGKTGLEPTIK